jgi:4-carboxymuconolactone decarboxylase
MEKEPSESPGAALRRRAQGAKADQLQALLNSLDPGVGKWADEFVFGEVWRRPGLDFESRMLVAITSLATQGKGALLRNYAHGALQAGVSARKIHEALVELVVYAGFPTATSMLFEWQQALGAARRQGLAIHEDIGEFADIYDNS